MKYLVAVKQVPDLSRASVGPDGLMVRAGVPSVLNPYCEYALGRILDMRKDDDTVEVFTMGPPQAESALRRCLELGADRAYLLTDKSFAGADTWATARAIVAFITRFACDADLMVFGRQAVDGDTGQVPYQVAQMLDVQQFAYTESLTVDGEGFVAVQDYGDVRRTSRVPSGSVVSFGGVDPNGRLPTISGYLRASGMDIVTVDRVALGLGAYSVGLKGSMTRIVSTEAVRSSRRNRKVEIRDPKFAASLILQDVEALR